MYPSSASYADAPTWINIKEESNFRKSSWTYRVSNPILPFYIMLTFYFIVDRASRNVHLMETIWCTIYIQFIQLLIYMFRAC
jgi:hypothetical protein